MITDVEIIIRSLNRLKTANKAKKRPTTKGRSKRMTVRKIDAMHKYYGYGSGRCEDCPHFRRKVYALAKETVASSNISPVGTSLCCLLVQERKRMVMTTIR